MAIEYEDIVASIMKAVNDATLSGQPLEDENILFPGRDWNTENLESWSIPTLSRVALSDDTLKGGDGIFTALIRCRLTHPESAYRREEIAGKYRRAMESLVVTVKNYISGNGATTLGHVEFTEGELGLIGFHDGGIYSGTWDLKFYLRVA